MLVHACIAQLLQQVDLLCRVEVVEQLQCSTIEFMHATHSQAVLVTIRKDAHVTASKILEPDCYTKQFWSLLRVEILVVVGTHSNNREVETITTNILIDGWDVNAERATLVVLCLVTLQQLAGLLVKSLWYATFDDVRDTDVSLFDGLTSEKVTCSVLDGLNKLSVVDG